MSALSASTRGGTTYDLLCSGITRSYSYNLVDLNDCQPLSFDTAANALVKQVDDTLTNIAIQQPDKEIEAFTIGKSHARQRSKKKGYGRSFIKFDRKDPKTWKFDGGINSRWREYAQKGYSGLIALTAITRKVIPFDVRQSHGKIIDSEQYSIALEQQLIHHYMLKKADQRLENLSFNPGNLCHAERKPFAGIVYVAFKLRDVEDDGQSDFAEEDDDEDNDEASRITMSFTAIEGESLENIPGPSSRQRTSNDFFGRKDPARSHELTSETLTPAQETHNTNETSEDHYPMDVIDSTIRVDPKAKRVSPRTLARLKSSPHDQYQDFPQKQKKVSFAPTMPKKSILKVKTNKTLQLTAQNTRKADCHRLHESNNQLSYSTSPNLGLTQESSETNPQSFEVPKSNPSIGHENDGVLSRENHPREDHPSTSKDAEPVTLPTKRKCNRESDDSESNRPEKQTCLDGNMLEPGYRAGYRTEPSEEPLPSNNCDTEARTELTQQTYWTDRNIDRWNSSCGKGDAPEAKLIHRLVSIRQQNRDTDVTEICEVMSNDSDVDAIREITTNDSEVSDEQRPHDSDVNGICGQRAHTSDNIGLREQRAHASDIIYEKTVHASDIILEETAPASGIIREQGAHTSSTIRVQNASVAIPYQKKRYEQRARDVDRETVSQPQADINNEDVIECSDNEVSIVDLVGINQSQHKCNICSKHFKSKANLKRHTSNVHEKLRSQPCKYCDKSFFDKSKLNKHEIEAHMTLYSCKQCGKQFSDKAKCKKHENTHWKPLV
ncbi:uncharacterized protein [Amphiura filiformis]|uniref:uncharacterized protein n=1 Tax=Amphiura filiformis TaxID=82378 RepID=UPI003B217EF2